MNELTTLGDLKAATNDEHRKANEAASAAILHAQACGRHLLEIKTRLPHGEFGKWLKHHFEGSARTARVYMQVAKNWERIQNGRQTAVLTIEDAVKLLAEPKPKTVQVENVSHGFMEEDHIKARNPAILEAMPNGLLDESLDGFFGIVVGPTYARAIRLGVYHSNRDYLFYEIIHWTEDSDDGEHIYGSRPILRRAIPLVLSAYDWLSGIHEILWTEDDTDMNHPTLNGYCCYHKPEWWQKGGSGVPPTPEEKARKHADRYGEEEYGWALAMYRELEADRAKQACG